jgi:lipopolysaccharide transport system permease protein
LSASFSAPAPDPCDPLAGGHHERGAGLVTVVAPRRGLSNLHLGALLHYYDLLRLLVLRDIQVRYRQSLLGALWALLQPVLTMIVLSAIMGRLIGRTGMLGQVPYPIFLYAALLPWTLFSTTVNTVSTSLINNANLLSKVYFPRLILPLSAAGAPLVDFLIASAVLVAMMAWYHIAPGWGCLLAPALVATLMLTALGVGTLLAALTVMYRDFRHVALFLLQVWFFLTPILLPTTALPPRWRWLWQLNPASGAIATFRAAVLGQDLPWAQWGISALLSVVSLLLALAYFSRTERRFADVV